MEEQVISIEEMVQALKKRWKLIVIITLTVTLLAGIVTFFVIKPQYQASMQVFVGKEGATTEGYNQNDISMYQNLMKTYAATIKTKKMVGKAVDNAGVNLSVDGVLDNLLVEPLPDTQILKISLKGGNPQEVKNVVESIGNRFIESSKELVPNGNVQIVEPVETPEKPVSPNKVMNIAIAFLLGIMVSVGICFLLEFLDNTFKTKEQLEREIEIPVIGVIPNMGEESRR